MPAGPLVRIEEGAQLTASDYGLAERRNCYPAGNNQEDIHQGRKRGSESAPRPILPPEGDHRGNREGKRGQRSENPERGLEAASAGCNPDGYRYDYKQSGEAQARLAAVGGRRFLAAALRSANHWTIGQITRPALTFGVGSWGSLDAHRMHRHRTGILPAGLSALGRLTGARAILDDELGSLILVHKTTVQPPKIVQIAANFYTT